jgi:hypothetical protein
LSLFASPKSNQKGLCDPKNFPEHSIICLALGWLARLLVFHLPGLFPPKRKRPAVVTVEQFCVTVITSRIEKTKSYLIAPGFKFLRGLKNKIFHFDQ